MKIKIFCDAERADFDIFGFIGKEIKEVKEEHNSAASGEDSLDCKLANNCVKAVGELFEELKLDSEKQSELLKELKNILGAKSMENLKKSQNEDVVFPFYSLDMSYNIMKRVRKKLRENIKLKEKNAYDYYCKVYEYIANGLKEDDDYYNRDGEKVHFLKDFLDSPYMQAFEITVGGVKYNQQKDKKIISAFWEAALEQIGKELIAPNIQNQDIL